MPRLFTQLPGSTLDFQASSGDDLFAAPLICVRNGGPSAVTVTVHKHHANAGTADVVVNIPPGEERIIGALRSEAHFDRMPDGTVADPDPVFTEGKPWWTTHARITCSPNDGVTIAPLSPSPIYLW